MLIRVRDYYDGIERVYKGERGMKTIIDICDIVSFNICCHCKRKIPNWCYTWDICTGRLMEILAYNMVMEGEY